MNRNYLTKREFRPLMVGVMPTYGANLKRLRSGKLTQEALALKAKRARQANLPQYENNHKFPGPKLVRRHADLIGVSTSELMCGVVTEFDRVRFPNLTDAQREALLGGLALMKPDHLLALVQAGAQALEMLLAEEAKSAPVSESTSAIPARALRTHPRKRRA